LIYADILRDKRKGPRKRALAVGIFGLGPHPSTAFGRTLAGVLFAAGGNTTFQAHALAAAAGRQGEARLGSGTGSSFAISFGNDFVAHGIFQKVKKQLVF
jgi:hypothetical protein